MCLAHDVVRDVVLCTIYNIMGMCILYFVQQVDLHVIQK